MKKGKIVFIVDMLTQPRCIKRVKAFHDDDFECHVFGYDRGKYDVNSYPDGVEVTHLGHVKDREYFQKSIKTIRDIRKIIRQYKNDNVVFYAFGFLQALILKTLRKKYVYEISDILYAYPNFKYVLPLLKIIDKKLIKKSLVTTMTSGGFYQFFGLKEPHILVLPNKVSPTLSRKEVEPLHLSGYSMNFGFVGAIRYDTVFRFAEVVGKYYPQHSFHFFGGSNVRLQNLLQKGYNNVYWHGIFKNPNDLPSIYKIIDIVVACYEVNSLNERLAEPNKLYEALFYCKPILVSDGIYLSERVKELNCGFCIDATTEDSIKFFIDNLKSTDLCSISNHEYRLANDIFVHDQSELNNRVALCFDDSQ